MGARDFERQLLSGADGGTRHEADVLVIGGGPAGAWAAVSAAARGARVLLADKGFCGTSGATAPSGTGLWHVPAEGTAREEAKASRFAMGGQLAEHAWMDRVLEQTWTNVETLKEWGYPFPVDDQGALRCTSLQGPEYMRLMRKRVKAAGARILDHSPVPEGAVAPEVPQKPLSASTTRAPCAAALTAAHAPAGPPPITSTSA